MPIYPYQCPRCRIRLDLKQRVTMKPRRCPECGFPIKVREIDRQAEAAARREAALYEEYLAQVRSRRRRSLLVSTFCGLGVLSLCGCCLYLPSLIGTRKPNAPRDDRAGATATTAAATTQAGAAAITKNAPAPTDAADAPPPAVKPETPKEVLRHGMTFADRKQFFADWKRVPHEAERATVEEMGHRPRMTDFLTYTIKFKKDVERRTKEGYESLLKSRKLTRPDAEDIVKEGDTAGWPPPKLTPIKERD